MPLDLRESLRPGCRAFDAGRFWDAHEAWEEAWHADHAPGRAFHKGLIQFAAVQHHLQRGNRAAALALLDRGRIEHHLLANRPLAWPLPVGLLLLVAAAQRRGLATRPLVPHTALRLEPYLDRWI